MLQNPDVTIKIIIMFVYILASQKNGTLYTGVTNDLIRRVYEHKHNKIKGFTNRYNIRKLVYYEEIDDKFEALGREKKLKNRHRLYKIKLIEKENPDWKDLYDNLK